MTHFISVYTNKCKEYCEEMFFKRLFQIAGENSVFICDNSEGMEYYEHLKNLYGYKATVLHSVAEHGEPRTRALRNITGSLKTLRDIFKMVINFDTFTIVESDVVPYTENPIEELEKILLGNPKAGAVGGIYYKGWHKDEDFHPLAEHIRKVPHVLSGITMYRRELIEEFPFRWDAGNLGAFPDALISQDALGKWELYDYAGVKCRHCENDEGNRGWGRIW